MKGYYKIGETFIKGKRFEVFESEIDGNEVDWLLVNGDKKIYRNCLDVILL